MIRKKIPLPGSEEEKVSRLGTQGSDSVSFDTCKPQQ